eukprot:jgi/Mesvir1/2304/Mv19337-RA.1
MDICGFVGLGAMGYSMAGHLSKVAKTVTVYNRTFGKAEAHAREYGTIAARDLSELKSCHVVFTCLPTSDEVSTVAAALASAGLAPGTVLVDCTSGEPAASLRIANMLAERGILMVDSPVSGGPGGARAGTLTSMMGGPADDVARVRPLVQSFSRKIVHVGERVGSGHAVKAVNNAMSAAQLLLAGEGLLALAKMGIDPTVACDVINSSSGRSLMSEVRLPEEVLTGRFGYGFKLGLMRKDVGIANGLVQQNFPDATLFKEHSPLNEWFADLFERTS